MTYNLVGALTSSGRDLPMFSDLQERGLHLPETVRDIARTFTFLLTSFMWSLRCRQLQHHATSRQPGECCRWQSHAGESNPRQKGDDPKTDEMTKGADSNLSGWQPKETASQLPLFSRADCLINATPSRRPEAVGWAPSVWQARWLPPFEDCGSVASCLRQWWTEHTGGDPRTDHAIKVTARKEVLSNQREFCTKGGAPKTSVREGEGPEDPGVGAPLAGAGCRGKCQYAGRVFSVASRWTTPSRLPSTSAYVLHGVWLQVHV